MRNNIILETDSYKLSHARQYPPKTQKVYSYFESRGGEFAETVFFGLQYIVREYMEGIRVTPGKIDAAEKIVNAHVGPGVFNRAGWEHIVRVHGGRLPVRIKAVPEGSLVPVGNVLMTVENLDPECWWLTNYLETLLVQVWYPCTVATLSRCIKRDILAMLRETGDPSLVDFKLQDFGYRGSTSKESAGIGGAAHLLNFKGTDTIAAIEIAMEHYSASEMPGFSIPAAEHSTITSWGREHESDAMRNMLTTYPTGLVACVSDSYDIMHACREIWGKELRAEVLARDGTLVVRPDSGHPASVVIGVLDALGEAFGSTLNKKGYRVLDPHVRVIQGDGVDRKSIAQILSWMKEKKWSADNVTFGMGGALLQKMNRDTSRYAFKCSSVTVDGVECDVYKNPITDLGKASKRGRLMLVAGKGHPGGVTTVPYSDEHKDLLVTVFENGEMVTEHTFEQCRARAEIGLEV